MITLRPYQNTAICALRSEIAHGKKHLVLCAPTGAGKTVMFSYMVSGAIQKGKRCLIITHRFELLTQAGGTLSNFGITPVQIKAGRKIPNLMNKLVCVGMAQTLKRRAYESEYREYMANLDVVIIDEAHTQDAEKLLPYFGEQTVVIGATATPHREPKQPQLDDFYHNIIEVTTVPELIQQGFLAQPVTYGVKVDLSDIKIKNGDFDSEQLGAKFNEVKLYNGVYENYQKITPGKKAIIFSANVESSKTLVDSFKTKGLPIEHIDGNTPDAERKRILNWFKSTPDAMISNVGILNAGFDDPSINVVILYRATKSLPLYLQMCGRGSRTTPTKSSFTILDFGNNVTRHGFWEENREWSLRNKKKPKEGASPVKECPDCYAMLHTSVKDCQYCGHHFEPTQKEEREAIIVELQRMTYAELKQEVKKADFERLETIAEAKRFKKGWIYHQLKTVEDLEKYAQWKGYSKKWVEYQIKMRENNGKDRSENTAGDSVMVS